MSTTQQLEPVVKLPNGIFTFQNKDNGKHRTFKIRTVRGGNMKGKRLIGLLTGPDNTSDYRNFGFVTDNGIHVWNKYKPASPLFKQGTETSFEAFARMVWFCLALNKKQEVYGDDLKIDESRCCARCNRLLTEPESISSGIGPICRGKGLLKCTKTNT